MRAAAAALLLAALAFAGCATLRPVERRPLGPEDARPALRLAALRELASERQALRATARAHSEGPGGAGSSTELLLVQRPASLRVEVLGLLQQRVLVLATDGARYELYRSGDPVPEEGPVHAGVLEEVAGLPLTPEAAVALLLAAPEPPAEPPAGADEDASGALLLAWPDQSLEFDSEGRLRSLRFHPADRDVLLARWDDWRDTGGGPFPYHLELELPEKGTRLVLDYRQLELDPALDPALFRLGLGTR